MYTLVRMRVVILIPTYNEIENIEKLLKDLLSITKFTKKHKVQILIVDDNSPDGTGEFVKKYQKKNKDIILLSGAKKGLGRAMVRGYKYAIDKMKADIVVTNEADFAFDIKKHFPKMIEKIGNGVDVVVGSRHVGVGKTEGWTLKRKLNHWVANTFFATWVAGVTEVYDHNGAFRAIRVRGVLDSIGLENIKVGGFGFFFYSIYKLTTVTDKIVEIPVTYRFRKSGESKVSFNSKYFRTYLKDVLEYIVLSFKIRFSSV